MQEALPVRIATPSANFILQAPQVQIELGEASFRVVPTKDWLLNFWLKIGEWEPETFRILRKYTSKQSTYLDIGAWVGPTVLYAAGFAGKVIAVEPDRVAYQELGRNVFANDFENIFLHRCCICEQDEWKTFGAFDGIPVGRTERMPGALGDSMSRVGSGTERVLGKRLDTFVRENRLENIGLIKIDIEGGEETTIPASREYLTIHKPSLYLSMHANYFRDPENVQAICETLRGAYSVILDSSEQSIRDHLPEFIEKNPHETILALGPQHAH